jgi:2-C-methyl-D-erythritol 4-phosphate cytidylyltransferase
VDSIRRVFPDGRSEAVDRSEYRAVQTPQAFRLEDLREAYLRPFEPAMTDDASVMEAAGRSDIALVDGADCLMKITRPGDLDIVERML